MWLAQNAFFKIKDFYQAPFKRKLASSALLMGLLLVGEGYFSMLEQAQAMALFAGVSEIRLSENPTGQILVQLKADLPFQYQLKVLDENRIALTLLNARLANALKEANGHLHLSSSVPITQSLYLNADVLENDHPREEVILEASGLGQREIVVEGATRVATPEISTQPDSPFTENAFEEERLEVSPRLQKRIEAKPVRVATTPKAAGTSAHTPKLHLQEPEPSIAIATPYTPHRSATTPLAYTLGGSRETHTLPTTSSQILKLNTPQGSTEAAVNNGVNALALVEGKPYTPPLLMKEALAFYRQNQLQQATDRIRQALILEPQNGALYAALAEVYLKGDNITAAKTAYQEAIQRSTNPRYPYRYAVTLLRNGDRMLAIQTLENLLKRNPTQGPAHYLLGTLYQELGQSALAIAHLQRAEQLNPKSADIHYTLGLAYELDGNRDLAKTHYTKAIQLNPVAHEAVQALERIKS